VGKKLVYRLYREEGLALRHKPRKRRRTALHRRDRFRPSDVNQTWSLDFVADQLADGRRFRALPVVDVFTRESLAIEVGQKVYFDETTKRSGNSSACIRLDAIALQSKSFLQHLAEHSWCSVLSNNEMTIGFKQRPSRTS